MAIPPDSAATTTPGTKTIRWFLGSLLLSILASWVAYQQFDRPAAGIDDANIFLTYGQNLSRGDGFVYYRGGERVEGFSSLLWTLVCSLCFLLTDHPEPLLLGINIGLLSSTIFITIRFLQTRGPPGKILWIPVVAWGWCLLNPKFVIWTTLTLMDIGLWCFTLTLGTLVFAKAASSQKPLSPAVTRSLCGCLVLALLTRPEAMLIGLVWLAGLGLGRQISHRDSTGNEASSGRSAFGQALRDCLAPAIAYLLILGGLTCFRRAYFGYPLPNTYYAKVSPDVLYNLKLGLGYLRDFFLDQPWAGVGCLVLGLGACRFLATSFNLVKRSSSSRQLLQADVIALSAVAAVGAPVLTGGDHFALYRFFQPAWPLLLIAGVFPLLAWIAGKLSSRPRWLTALLLGLLLATFYTCQRPWWNGIGPEIQVEFDYARSGRELGNQLNRLFPAEKKPSLGIITTGGIGYAYNGPLVDLMGLNSVRMGHSPGDRRGDKNHAAFDREVFFQLSPDLVDPWFVVKGKVPKVPEDMFPERGGFREGVLQNVHRSKRFQQVYQPVLITCREDDQGEPQLISTWCKQAVIDRLKEQGITVDVLPGRVE